jgi:hypothetical protein
MHTPPQHPEGEYMPEALRTKPESEGTVSLPIRLTTAPHVNQPALSNYTCASVAQGLAYVEFGFIEPSLMSAIHQNVQQGNALPKHLEGKLTTRVVLPLDGLLRLQQQLAKLVMKLQGQPIVRS